MNVLDVAVDYIGRGWAPVPIPYMAKGPTIEGWPKLRISRADAPRFFNGARQNVGVILGQPSGNLVDIDLDCTEAVALAPALLPPTESVFGRSGKSRSHWLYPSAVPKLAQFVDPDDGETLLEVRVHTADRPSSRQRPTRPASRSNGTRTGIRPKSTPTG